MTPHPAPLMLVFGVLTLMALLHSCEPRGVGDVRPEVLR